MQGDQVLSEALLAAAAQHSGRPLDALRAMGHAYRAFAVAYPDLYMSSVPSTPLPQEGPEPLGVGAEPIELAATLFGQLGVPADQQIHLIRTYAAMLHGLVVLELGGEPSAYGADETFAAALDKFFATIDTHA